MTAAAASSALGASRHHPVMLDEVVAALAPRDNAIYVDGTFGGGGYSRALLDAAACRVWGIDRDPRAIARGRKLQDIYGDRLQLIEGRLGEMEQLLALHGITQVDGIALDLGISSDQLDDPDRGLSFQSDGPLDMRLGKDGPTAAMLVNETDEDSLARIIRAYGDERQARRIARAIVAARLKQPFSRTGELAATIREALGGKAASGRIDPATRTFLALRLYVNDELGDLARGLVAAERLLAPEGRLAVVSFHSLEDRLVKRFLADHSGGTNVSRHQPAAERPPASFRLLYRRAQRPGAAETAVNPRARSARLRAAERLPVPASSTLQLPHLPGTPGTQEASQ